MKNGHFLFLAMAGVVLLASCNGKQTVPLTVIPVEDYQKTLDVKEIFRRSDFENISSWIVPDKNGDLMIQMGKPTFTSNSYLTVWDRNTPFYFTMEGGAEGVVQVDIPPVGDSQAVDVPFSFEMPWSLSSDSVPETYSRLVALGFSQSGQIGFQFGEETPFHYIDTDIKVFFPQSISVNTPKVSLSYQNVFQQHTLFSPDHALTERISMTGACDVPDDYQLVPAHAVRLDSILTVNGTLHLEKDMLKEGKEWPDHVDLSVSLAHQGDVYRTHGVLNLPSEFTIPDISFDDDLRIRPYLFQSGKANLPLYDMRMQLNFLNKTPFKTRIRGTVASFKKGELLHSIPFGKDYSLEAFRFNSNTAFYSGESACEKRIFLSESNRYPVTLREPFAEDDQIDVSLQLDGLSSLFVGDPDDIRFTDIHVERDPQEIVRTNTLDFEEAYFKLHGQIDTPFRAGNGFAGETWMYLYIQGNLFSEDVVLHKVIVEGKLTSTLPFNVELEDALWLSEEATTSVKKVHLPPCLDGKASSADFQIQVESEEDLRRYLGTSYSYLSFSCLFRLFADETCAGRPINESAGITMSDVVVKY